MIRTNLARVTASTLLSVTVCTLGYEGLARHRTPSTPVEEYVGITHPGRKAEIGSAMSGRVAQIHVRPGDVVDEQQILFELDSAVERLELARLTVEAESRAELQLALARHAKASAEADRIADLTKQDIVSESEQTDALADLRIADAEVARARERNVVATMRRAEAKARLDRRRGCSPFAGRIESIEHEFGESIDALETILTIVDLETLYVEFPCPVGDLDNWREGAVAGVRTDDGQPLASATVTFVSRNADVASQTALVRLELDNRAGRWLAGQKVWIRRTTSPSAPPTGRGK